MKINIKREVKKGAILLLIVTAFVVSMSNIAYAVTDQTWLKNASSGQVAAGGNCRYIAVGKGDDTYVITEDDWAGSNYNNLNGGYVIAGATGFARTDSTHWPVGWLTATDTYAIWASSIADNQTGYAAGTIGSVSPNYTTPGTFPVPDNQLILGATNYMAPPGNFAAYAGNGRAVLLWNTVSGATQYRIFRGPIAGVGASIYSRVATTSNKYYEDTTVSNGTTYYYIVVPMNGSGWYGTHTDQLSAIPTNDSSVPTETLPLSPNTGSVGTVVTIEGTGFGSTQGTGEVLFNGVIVPPSDIVSWTGTKITLKVPSGATTGNVYVINSSGKVSNGQLFTVTGPVIPAIISVTKNYGYNTARSVTVTGSGFTGTTAISLDAVNIPPVNYTVNNDTSITLTIPGASALGAHYVRVTNANGTSPTGAGSQYTVVGLPTVTSVTPPNGPATNTIAIGGTNLLGDGTDPVTITVNGISRTFTASTNNTTITNISVSGLTLGVSYDVTVTNPVGTSAINQPGDWYTVNAAGTLQFSLANYSVTENGGSATITVTRTGGSSGVASITYATSNGTATAGQDYTTAGGTLNWTDGDAASKPFTVFITNDTLDENDETVNLTLSGAVGATLGAPSTAVLTITDNDNPPTVQFSSAASNGPESTTPANMPVTLSTASGLTVTVNYAVTGGTATGLGIDYTLAAGTLTFTPGVTSQNISATIVDDAIVESPDETIIVTLSVPTNATLGAPATHTYTINDNDSAPTPDDRVYEGSGGIMMAYPNPFNPNDRSHPLKMLFSAATGEAVDIYIFDANARIIWQYKGEGEGLGANRTVEWDGKTHWGETVDNGYYMIRVVNDGKMVAKGKILVVKK